MIRILITGDRCWKNRSLIYQVLHEVVKTVHDDTVIITEGDAEGADKMAGWAALDLQAHFSIIHDPHPAKWYRPNPKTGAMFFFKGAGPERNDEMLNLKDPRPTVVLAFHNRLGESKGTRHCVLGAIKRGFPVQLFAENEESHHNPCSFSTAFISAGQGGCPDGRPEDILQKAIERLYPLTW